MSLAVHALGASFANPFLNAAGVCCSTEAELRSLAASGSGAFVSKSCTRQPRAGNPSPRYHSLPLGSINSMGLPNLGAAFYLDFAARFQNEEDDEDDEEEEESEQEKSEEKTKKSEKMDKKSDETSATTTKKKKKRSKKPLFVSVSGLSIEENVDVTAQLRAVVEAAEARKLAKKNSKKSKKNAEKNSEKPDKNSEKSDKNAETDSDDDDADDLSSVMLELNLSCPNVPGKPQIAYDFDSMRRYLAAVSVSFGRPFGVKMPPYFDTAHFDSAAAILNAFPLVKFITCVNSIGNGLVIDAETETVAIKPKDGFGGLGGRYILPTALANVNAFYRRCGAGRKHMADSTTAEASEAAEGPADGSEKNSEKIKKKKQTEEDGADCKIIIGCGGVYSGEDAFLHILAGASLVQVGTALHEEGVAIFDRLQTELKAIMDRKGYKSMDEFRGKVKTIA